MLNVFKWIFSKEFRHSVKEKKDKKDIEFLYPKGFYEKMLKIKPTVVNILQNNPATKDDDILLLFVFWEREVGGSFYSYEQFKSFLMQGKLAIPDTITRTRRKLQADHPELRGELYELRKKAEGLVTSQMALNFD